MFWVRTVYPKGTDGRRYDRAAHDRGCRKKFVRGIVTDEFNVGKLLSGVACMILAVILSRHWLSLQTLSVGP
jgi:hypothetical protein